MKSTPTYHSLARYVLRAFLIKVSCELITVKYNFSRIHTIPECFIKPQKQSYVDKEKKKFLFRGKEWHLKRLVVVVSVGVLGGRGVVLFLFLSLFCVAKKIRIYQLRKWCQAWSHR